MLSFGGFLNSSFWSNYRSPSSTSIEEILTSKDCSVERLLEDDDCLQEFKNLNDKLIGYFDHEKLKKLIDLITVMPPEDASHNRGHKFPFVASEIFNCEINSILDKFFEPIEQKKDEDQDETDGSTKVEEKIVKTQDKFENDMPELHEQKEETSEEKNKEAKEESETKSEETKEESKTESQEQKVEAKVEQSDEQSDKKVGILDAKVVQEEEKVGVKISEPEDEESTIRNKSSKYVLLDRLFNFLRTNEKPLNPVLSGYFSKLVTLFINRKQKMIIPYVFHQDSDVIDRLLYHVGQKSIADLLTKFLNIQDQDFEGDLATHMAKKQQEVIETLLNKLGPDVTEEDNLNGAMIISDMLEFKEFYLIAIKRQNLQKLLDFVLNSQSSPTHPSKNASLLVLNTILQQFPEKHKGGLKNSAKKKDDEDDDVQMQGSEDEDESGESPPMIELLRSNLARIVSLLETAIPQTEIANSFDSSKAFPLGSIRLKVVELIQLALKVHKAQIYEALVESQALPQITALVKVYPWNNFLQLKVISIYEEIIESSECSRFRGSMLSKSNIGQTVVSLSRNNQNYIHQSNRVIRHGYMAVITKVANLLQKNSDKEEVKQYLQKVEGWQKYADEDLKRINEVYNRSLGGQQPRSQNADDDDNDNNYEVNMEKIMARFTNFNSIQSSQSNQEDEEDEDNKGDDEEVEEQQKKSNQDDEMFKDLPLQVEELAQEPPSDPQYSDNNYWKPSLYLADDLDKLLAEEGLQ